MTTLTDEQIKGVARSLDGKPCCPQTVALDRFNITTGPDIVDDLRARASLFRCCECGLWTNTEHETELDSVCEDCASAIDAAYEE